MNKIFISTSSFAEFSNEAIDLLHSQNINYRINDKGRKLSDVEVPIALEDFEGVIAGTEIYSKEILEKLIPYFTNDLPYKKQSDLAGMSAKEYNSKITTYMMQGIANHYEVHIRTIQRIVKQYKDDYKDFLPYKK